MKERPTCSWIVKEFKGQRKDERGNIFLHYALSFFTLYFFVLAVNYAVKDNQWMFLIYYAAAAVETCVLTLNYPRYRRYLIERLLQESYYSGD